MWIAKAPKRIQADIKDSEQSVRMLIYVCVGSTCGQVENAVLRLKCVQMIL